MRGQVDVEVSEVLSGKRGWGHLCKVVEQVAALVDGAQRRRDAILARLDLLRHIELMEGEKVSIGQDGNQNGRHLGARDARHQAGNCWKKG